MLEKSMDYLAWWHIAGAVLDVFQLNQRNEAHRQYKASADSWCMFDCLRQEIFNNTIRFWCERTGRDKVWFPYSIDGVCRLYFRFRKRPAAEVANFKSEIASHKGTCRKELFDE
jgi:hypothetical protein